MILLDGIKTAAELRKKLCDRTNALVKSGLRAPHLAAILVGNNGASETYVTAKIKACSQAGFRSSLYRFDETVTETELKEKINSLNEDSTVDGILVQLPLPSSVSEQNIMQQILPSKDVDGFHPLNFGKMALGQKGFVPATPKGILMLLHEYKINTAGKHCVVIGRSSIVGLPLSLLLAQNSDPGNCTVTLCHSRTSHLRNFTLQADILIAAIGKPGFIKSDMIKEGAVVIDVGITREKTENGFRLKGDVDFDQVAPKCSYITPVPGGVGPMTIAALLENTMAAAELSLTKEKK